MLLFNWLMRLNHKQYCPVPDETLANASRLCSSEPECLQLYLTEVFYKKFLIMPGEGFLSIQHN